MIRAIIFDLDETLHQRSPSLKRFAGKLFEALRPDTSEVEFVDTFMRLDRRGYRSKEDLFGDMIETYNLPIDAETLAHRFQTTAWNHPVLFPGAQTTLETLKTRGYRLGLITNGSELAQTAKITHSGLGALIDVCLVSGTIGIRKPAPAIFTMMSKAVGIPLHECAMVGDSPELDIAGASRAGMRAIWMQGVAWPTDLPRNYDAAIRSITDVPDVVATL